MTKPLPPWTRNREANSTINPEVESALSAAAGSTLTFAEEMPIASDLEKLALLRDSGDLSQAEFEKAKERLLSSEVTGVSPATERNQPPLPEEVEVGKPKHTLLIAILSTIAAALSGGSAAINPSPLGVLAFAGFTIASTLNWIVFSKRRVRK